MRAVTFHPDARAELLAAIRFYREEAVGLGRAMAGELRSALERAAEFPESGSPDGDDLRKVFLGRFPFTLVYRAARARSKCSPVMHQRQRPGYWQTRVE